MKAFIVNRVGDFGFALGIFGLFYLSGSVVFGGEAGCLPSLSSITQPRMRACLALVVKPP